MNTAPSRIMKERGAGRACKDEWAQIVGNDLLPETLSHPQGLFGEQSAFDALLVAHGTRNDLCDDEDCPISPQTEQNNASWTPKFKINQKSYRNNQTGNPKIKNMTFFSKSEPGGTIF